MANARRRQLREELERLAAEYLADCPFATSALHILVAAIDTACEKEFAESAVDWMFRELERTNREIAAACGMKALIDPNHN